MREFKASLRRLANKMYRHVDGRIRARHIDITDEYVRSLMTVNVGFLHYGNLHLFNFAIERLPSAAPMLEIGSYCGLSTNLLTYYKRRNGVTNKLFTCDKWVWVNSDGTPPLETFPGTDIATDAMRDFVKETYIRNVERFSHDDLPYTIETLSDEFFAEWVKRSAVIDVFGRSVDLGGPISFAYIDGNHSYDFARRDFENCDRFLEQGGFILFDDSSDAADLGSARLAREAGRSSRYEIIATNPNYLVRKL